jgi:hypothetical protein
MAKKKKTTKRLKAARPESTFTRIAVSELVVDPKNPRHITAGLESAGQGEIIARLCETDRVLDIAESIAVNGYRNFEPLIVIRGKGGFVAVEGNRRAAALKILTTPELAPPEFQKRVRELVSRAGRIPSEIDVVVVASRNDVVDFLLQRHGQQPTVAWSQPDRAEFVMQLLESGDFTIAELKEKAGPNADIEREISKYYLWQGLQRAPLGEESQKAITDPRSASFTTYERVVRSVPGQEWLGIRFGDEGEISGTRPLKQVLRGMAKIFDAVQAGTITSRTAGKKDQIIGELSKLKSFRPAGAGRFSTAQLMASEPIKDYGVSGGSAKSVKRRTVRAVKVIIPSGFVCTVKDQKILEMIRELKTTSMSDTVCLGALGLRTLVEMAVISHIDRSIGLAKCEKAIVAERHKEYNKRLQKKGQGPVPQVEVRRTPGFGELAQWMLSNCAPTNASSQDLSGFKKYLKQDLADLNGFVHHLNAIPTEKEIRSAWVSVSKFLECLIGERADA